MARQGQVFVDCSTTPVSLARELAAAFAARGAHFADAPVAGQAVKLLNNMVLSITIVALAEALAVAKASGAVDPKLLFDTLAKARPTASRCAITA